MKDLIEKLKTTIDNGSSLGSLVQKRIEEKNAKQTFLLADCSGSMGEYCEPKRTKIEALRELVESLKNGGLIFTLVIFPGIKWAAEIASRIPEPMGGTPLHGALEVALIEGARHVVLISDGIPDNEAAALLTALELAKKRVAIDVFYVGPYPHPGEKFLKKIANATAGKYQATSIATTKKLTNQVRLALESSKK